MPKERATLDQQGWIKIFFKKNADHFKPETAFDVAILDPPRRGAPGVVAELVIHQTTSLFMCPVTPKHLDETLALHLKRATRLNPCRDMTCFLKPSTLRP